MAPRYAPNIRGRLPWLVFFIEIMFVIIFVFFVSFEPMQDGDKHIEVYSAFQDVNVMIFLGFGFLFAFLTRYGFSSIAFNLLIAAVGVQWAVIMDGFLFSFKGGFVAINIKSVLNGAMSIMSVLISAGALLGKANPVQLVCMTLMEVSVFTANRWIITNVLKVASHVSMMYVHIFGAYFGLAIAWLHYRPILCKEVKMEKCKSNRMSEVFSMLGTIFLWMFWPTFNSVLIQKIDEKTNAVHSTYYATAVSAVTAFAMSVMTNEKGHLNMIHIRNATLAGGVAVSFSAYMINDPWIAMTLALLAAIISVLGLKYLQAWLNSVFHIHDTCGVHATFGLCGLLGGITHVILPLIYDRTFTLRGYEALVEVSCICLTLFLSIGGGLITAPASLIPGLPLHHLREGGSDGVVTADTEPARAILCSSTRSCPGSHCNDEKWEKQHHNATW